MKNIFLPKDIKEGLIIIKETSPKGCKNLGFACSVSYKIGFGYFDKQSDKGSKQQYCFISIFTDGMVSPIGFTKEDVAEYLNKDNHGYRTLTIEECISLIEYSKSQLFY
jgi:hypothetical protein